jgi:hypothetical protein
MRTACDKAMPRLPRPTHEIPYELEIDDQTWNDGNAKNRESCGIDAIGLDVRIGPRADLAVIQSPRRRDRAASGERLDQAPWRS